MASLPSPSEARTIVTLAVIPAFQLEHRLTCGVIGGLPDDRADFKPEDGARPAGQLARHIVTTELRWLDGVADGVFRDIKDASGAPEVGAALIEYYKGRFASALAALTSMPDEHLVRVIDYRGFIKMPALAYLTLAMHHSIHHRGQLSVYLRTMGLPVPRIYG